MVHITQSNAVRIVYQIDRTELNDLDGDEAYTKKILILSNREKRQLLAIRKFFEEPELFINSYFGNAREQNNEDLVFKGSPPAYHASTECGRLYAEYKNYKIPKEIKEREETDPGIRSRFCQWCEDNRYLLEKTNPEYNQESFILLIKSEFKIDILDEVNRQNSGITDMKNASLDEIQTEIDRILSEAGKWFYASGKHEKILRAYQKRTYLAYKDSPLPDNNTSYSDDEVKEFLKDYEERFRNPLKDNLIMYYRMRYNPDLSFDGKLLDQVGFHPCKQCHQKEVDS